MKSPAIIFFIILCLCSCTDYLTGQKPNNQRASRDTIKVLFIGNSYTYFNDLPQLVKNIAVSDGKTIITKQDTPGGVTLEYHWNSGVSQKLIKEGNWNYMVLQEFSQRPSEPLSEFNHNVFPFVEKFDSLFKRQNPKGKTILYMTWGRKNGDSSRCGQCPDVCTYEGMDSLTRVRYLILGDKIGSYISPVGAVWRYIRNNHPEIELYNSDGSHPSINGSIVGAFCFYTIITQKNPSKIVYNASISPVIASEIKDAVEKVAYDSLYYWNVGTTAFSYKKEANNQVSFHNFSRNYDSLLWDFGDGQNSTEKNPLHQYPKEEVYRVTLYITRNNKISCFSSDISTILRRLR